MNPNTVKALSTGRKLIINSSNGKKGTVNSVPVLEQLDEAGLHNMNFYYFVYAGLLSKVRMGEYKIGYAKLSGTTDEQVLTKALEHMAKSREQKKAKNNDQEKYDIKESECIAFLKGLGYKIMKPVNQFEEV